MKSAIELVRTTIAKSDYSGVAMMSSNDISSAISSIGETLKGFGVGQLERLALNEERKLLRAELTKEGRGSMTVPLIILTIILATAGLAVCLYLSGRPASAAERRDANEGF